MRRVRDVLLEISRSVASGGCYYWSFGIDMRGVCFISLHIARPKTQSENAPVLCCNALRLYNHAYRAEYGTYLPIDEKNNGRILQLNNAPGRFRYRVTVSKDGFVAYAEADFDRDGKAEVWVVDARGIRTGTQT